MLQNLHLPGQARSPITTTGSLLILSPVCFWSGGGTVPWDPEKLNMHLISLSLLPDAFWACHGLHSWGKGSSTCIWLSVVPSPCMIKNLFCLDITGWLQKNLTYSLSIFRWQEYLEKGFIGGPCQTAQGTLWLKVTFSEAGTRMWTK